MAESGEPVSKRLRARKDTVLPGTSKSSTKTPASTSSTSESASAQENGSSSLLRLTDNCLQKVFERLDVDSLCQMANVCKRFRPITERAFSERHKKFVFKGQSCKYAVFRRVLCKFGYLITSIDASEARFVAGEQLDVNAIAKYCINSLEDLILEKAIIDANVLKPLISRLKDLRLYSCKFIGDANNLFTNCRNLERLAYEHDFSFSENDSMNSERQPSIGMVVKKFPKLEYIWFDCSYIAFAAFFRLLKLNPQLKQIEIIAPPEDHYIQEVVNSTKNVETLAIHPGSMASLPEIQTRQVFLQLSKLKKLQNLFIEACDETYGKLAAPLMDAFAKDKVLINRLDLREFTIGCKEFRSILKLKTMKIISLSEIGNVTDADLVPLTKELPLLENLQLYFGTKAKKPITIDGLMKMVKSGKHIDYIALVGVQRLKIDKKAFEGLLKAAQSRGNEKKLTIDIVGEKKTAGFNVPENVQKAGSKHLKILFTER